MNLRRDILVIKLPNFLDYLYENFYLEQEFCFSTVGLLPFFHSYGMAVFLSQALYNGAHTLCLLKFETESFLSAVRRHKVKLELKLL